MLMMLLGIGAIVGGLTAWSLLRMSSLVSREEEARLVRKDKQNDIK